MSGMDLLSHLRDPRLFKGMGFTINEREALGIHGLLPPRVKNLEEQAEKCMRNLRSFANPLNQYVYMVDLLNRNERLFYKLLSENVMELMPIVYTPTVGLACQKFGFIFKRPQGLFISIHDKGHVYDVLKNWPENDVRAICVTDGERILGLGDLGAQGMGIPVGKLALYTALAAIPPHQCLPIVLDVGTNRQELLDDVDYIGLRHKRVSGAEYDEFIDEFMAAVVRRYGQKTLIQFEDFGNQNAFRFLEKYRNKYCTFNDDIQGTASVAVAGILASLRATGTRLQDHKFLFQGAGEASIGIANLLGLAMEKREGVPVEEAIKKIWMKDSRGLIVKGRSSGGISEHKAPFAHDHAEMAELGDIVKELRPTCLIGAAAVAGVFTEEIIKDMASFNEQPIIFALSNPTSKAECTAEAAYTHSEGRAVFASGSPFPTFEGFGKRYEPGQGNNCYIFPGIALGIISAGLHHVSEAVFLSAAEALAECVIAEDLAVGRLYPPLRNIREISVKIAARVAREAYSTGTAATYPEPQDKEAFIMKQLYNYNYDTSLPVTWSWPKAEITTRPIGDCYSESSRASSGKYKIALIGATGDSGIPALRQLLERGHRVTAIIRSMKKMTQVFSAATVRHPNLRMAEADIFAPAELAELFRGHDVVVSALGFPLETKRPMTKYTESMESILTAMRRSSVTRLVCLSSWFTDKGSRKGQPMFDNMWSKLPGLENTLDNHAAMDQMLANTEESIDFTTLLVPTLTWDPKTDKPIVAAAGAFCIEGVSGVMCREDVARFVVAVAENPGVWRRQAVVVTTDQSDDEETAALSRLRAREHNKVFGGHHTGG